MPSLYALSIRVKLGAWMLLDIYLEQIKFIVKIQKYLTGVIESQPKKKKIVQA